MRRDVHLAALKAATKVAFAVALVGCSSADNSEDPVSSTGDDTVAEADLKGGKAKKHQPKLGSCHEKYGDGDATAPPALSCKEIVDAAFPKAGTYPGTKEDVSTEVAECCNDLLASKDPGEFAAGEHRWDCCANAAHPDQVGMACTPWGPPVPPSMNNRRARLLLGVA